ncbi:MAG: lysozyme inhibitor LprI family protein [Alphaproteobacteria bacterium]
MNIRFLLFSSLYLALPFNVHAQEPASGGQTIVDCWHDPAINDSHIAIGACEGRILKSLQSDMRQLYAKRKQEARKLDTASKRAGSNLMFMDAEKGTEQSQKDFETYMASECDRQVRSYSGGGSVGSDIWTACEIDLISQRIATLKADH